MYSWGKEKLQTKVDRKNINNSVTLYEIRCVCEVHISVFFNQIISCHIYVYSLPFNLFYDSIQHTELGENMFAENCD